MSEQELLLEVKGPVAWMTINREARRNALSLGMIELMSQYLDQVEADDSIRVICLTHAGEKAFCSGADLSQSLDGKETISGAKQYANTLKRMATFPKPIVARLNGHCTAGGLGLMLSCDMVYAKEEAKFGTPEVNVGLFPMMVGALLFRNVTRKRAMELVYTARMIQGKEAEEIGLITRAVPQDKLDETVNAALDEISQKAPLAIKMGRQAYAAAQEMNLEEALDYLCEQLGAVVDTEDAKEGLMAFMQKRTPEWKSR
jgi:enoyl-CoA hydratase/carnithine racemase